MAWLMPLSVAVSTFGSANGTIFAAGRLCYVASREGHLVDVLSFVHVKKLTPAPALLFHAFVALAMVLSGRKFIYYDEENSYVFNIKQKLIIIVILVS